MKELYSDEYFMQKAYQEALNAFDIGEVPVGAIIVSNKQIIAKGHNLTETLTDVTAHAEMQCITSAASFLGGKYLKGCTLYVTLEPCNMCAGALYWSQIDRIVVAAEDTKRGYRKFNTPLHPKTTIEFGLMKEKCEQLILDFFATKRG